VHYRSYLIAFTSRRDLTVSSDELIAAEFVRVVVINGWFGRVQLRVQLSPQVSVLFLKLSHLVRYDTQTEITQSSSTYTSCDSASTSRSLNNEFNLKSQNIKNIRYIPDNTGTSNRRKLDVVIGLNGVCE